MARTYHIDIATFAAAAQAKWVDNLLSVHEFQGVESARRGVARRISTHAIYEIALVHRLNHELGLSVDTAVSVARRMFAGSAGHVALADHLELRFDRHAFERAVDRRIAEAAESMVPARRGRPRLRRT